MSKRKKKNLLMLPKQKLALSLPVKNKIKRKPIPGFDRAFGI